MSDLTGLVALVTGGNGGIGLGIAEALARAGADVAVWGTNEEKNAAAEARLAATGRRAVALRCDVGEEAEVVDAFARTVDALGKVDVCFANAGISGYAPFVDMSIDEWRRVLRVNLDGAFLTLREAARHLLDRKAPGSLVAVSSTSTIHGAPAQQHYAASKAAMIAMMRGLAVELARHQVRCNTLVPGWTRTDLTGPLLTNEKFMEATTRRTPVRRWGVPEDMGPAAVFLADPRNLYHTGDEIVVDGGYTRF